MKQSRILISIVLAIIGIAALVLLVFFLTQPSPQILPIQSTTAAPGEKVPSTSEEIGEAGFPESAGLEVIQREIRTTSQGEILKYQEESYYSADSFSIISENQESFTSLSVEKFREEIIDAEALNCKVDLNSLKNSMVLQCDIQGAMYSKDSYSMHFLLNGTERFGFDLYGFQENGSKLVYEGDLNEVPTTITFEFPYVLSHCHEHVWPK